MLPSRQRCCHPDSGRCLVGGGYCGVTPFRPLPSAGGCGAWRAAVMQDAGQVVSTSARWVVSASASLLAVHEVDIKSCQLSLLGSVSGLTVGWYTAWLSGMAWAWLLLLLCHDGRDDATAKHGPLQHVGTCWGVMA